LFSQYDRVLLVYNTYQFLLEFSIELTHKIHIY